VLNLTPPFWAASFDYAFSDRFDFKADLGATTLTLAVDFFDSFFFLSVTLRQNSVTLDCKSFHFSSVVVFSLIIFEWIFS